MPCYQESQLQRLLLVQPGIAVGRVVQAEILINKAFTSASAFSHSIPRKLKMHATKERAVLLVHLERRRKLRENAAERASLDTGWCAAGVAIQSQPKFRNMITLDLPVHGIALPYHNMSTGLHSIDVCAKHRLNLVRSIARDQSNLANLFVRINDIEQLH
jgi:hypothetical protein